MLYKIKIVRRTPKNESNFESNVQNERKVENSIYRK